MPSDLRARLQRLRLQKVKRELPPASPAPRPPRSPAPALPGRAVTTRLGSFQLVESVYPLDYQHGPARFGDWLAHSPATAALLARDETLVGSDLKSLAFIDTETTGLAGGTGTLVFLVGAGVFDGDRFVLRQYFMRDPGEEEALLNALVADLAAQAGWVTFNGRSFDLPLLETRLTLIGQRGALGQRPHLDLLPPARRLYQRRLPSCKLGEIEHSVFKIIREQDDVPGALIPQMYLDYLRTGDASDMRRVIYHNAIDILSTVTLATHLLEVFATKLEPATSNFTLHTSPSTYLQAANRSSPPGTSVLQPEDLLRLAHWHDDNGRAAEAEAAYRRALEGELGLEARRAGLTRLAALLKRIDRRAEAAPLWEQLASFTLDDPEPFVELAKFYEWHETDILQAAAWTRRALNVVNGWPRGWRRAEAVAALQHRLERLNGKLKG